MKAEIRSFGGAPAVFLDGKPTTALMHWTRNPQSADTILFRNEGIHFYSFMGNLAVPAPEGTPEEELEFHDGGLPRMLLTPENIDKLMTRLVADDPEIKILPRIIMNPPVWWEKRHPEERMRFYSYPKRCYVDGPRASLASDSWRETWEKRLAETVRHFEAKWSEYIFGYHTGLGHCGEHDYMWWDNAADFSPMHHRVFLRWLEAKYKNIGELNRAWRSEFRSFAEIPVTDAVRFDQAGPRTPALFLPEKEQDLIDFQEFCSDLMADTLLNEARVVKQTLRECGSTKLFGAFYGYVNLVANSSQTTVGHSALNRVLESPDVDFLCGPLSYGARQAGGAALHQMIPGAITLHNKLFFSEDDTGTHLYPGPHHGYLPEDAATACHMFRRNFAATWSSGGTQWWMDLYGSGWFLDPALGAEFRLEREFAERHFGRRESVAEIAVFASLRTTYAMRDNPVPLTGSLIEHQLMEIAACGAPFDLFAEDDLPLLAERGKLKQYRFCIFLNTLDPSEAVRRTVSDELAKNGRSILWFYAPGYYRHHERDAAFAEELTGLRFRVAETGIMPMLTETRLNGIRTTYGLTRAVYPRLVCDDPAAESLGYFINGTTIAGQPCGSGTALARKKNEDWTALWSASPCLPAAWLTEFARGAGVHIWSERGDQIFTAPDWVAVHAKWDGPLTLRLPRRMSLHAYPGGNVFPETDALELNVRRGETLLFEY